MPENGQRPGTQNRPRGSPIDYVPIDQCMENGEARISERLWAERQLPEDLGIHLDKVIALEICKQEVQRPRCCRAV
jgi:hypothetical protein